MFNDKSLLFSPWFRLITNKWMIGDKNQYGVKKGGKKGDGWWDSLDKTMETDVFCDYETIHRFDPPSEHMGGGGNAGPMLDKDGELVTVVGDSS